MATAGNKTRIYDLAKELKLDNKKVIEDARREGIDVSVPSNTVPNEVAERIRAKYFPKKATPKVAPRLIKHAHMEAAPAEATAVEPSAEAPAYEAPPPAAPSVEPGRFEPRGPQVRVLKKAPAPTPLAPPTAQAAPPAAETAAPAAPPTSVFEPAPPAAEAAEAQAPTVEPAAPPITEPVAPPVAPATTPAPAALPRSGQQVRQLRRIPGAVVAPPAAPPATTHAGAPGGRPGHMRPGQPGGRPGGPGIRAEAAAPGIAPDGTKKPSTVYIPQDNRPRKRTRRGKRGPGEFGPEEGKHLDSPRTHRGTIAPKQKPVFTEMRALKVVEGITVKDFAEKIEVKPKDVVTEMIKRGVMATINQTINPEIAQAIGREFGYEISFAPFEEIISEAEEVKMIESGEEDLAPRAPVVTVMGHVDHGKTSLLDGIRETRVAEGEAGGITQHIGAYAVDVADPDNPEKLRRIVFLDTPGHEAFTMMRARGAKVTDVVVLVVAADDGVMPQTLEAIDHAKAAEVPIVVAINKIDKPDANPDRVKQELADRGLLWEGWGGDTVMVEVSAKQRTNIKGLLEMILITSDLLELKANADRLASGVVLEAKLDRGRGAVATVLVQQGTIKVGDPFIAGQIFGRVRAMFDDRGHAVAQVGPATPVEVLGLQGVPAAGDQLQVVSDATQAQHIASQRQMQARMAAIARTSARGLEQLFSEKSAVKELKVILKADVQGSVEAVRDVLNKLTTERVKISIIRSGVGAITESDVMLAAASSKDMGRAAVIIGFNVRPQSRAREIAENEGVDIRLHTIIYKVEEEIRLAMLGLLDATKREVITGHAEVRQVFRVPRVGQIAGCYITDGSIRRTTARILRDNVVIFEGKIESLRRFKDDVSEVKQGFECGISLERFQDVKTGDVIEAYMTEEVAPTSL
ncbi:MAG TPA: translation initiation factor IF-2 [Blastocatellia bacterium]|nr:translation initiation factor IF-2 [Blastocatellia bacterium]